MKKLLVILITLNITYSFGQELKSLTEYNGYVPSSVREVSDKRTFTDENGNPIDPYSFQLTDFNFITTTVTVVDDNDNIGGFGITYNKDVYKIIYSFENYVEAFDSGGNKYRIGSSIEVIAHIKTKKKNLDLSDLFSLAINANKNKIRGSLSMTAKGFSSDNIYGLFNINSSIDKASVQQVLKNVGIMISKFSDKTIKLKPVILGYESKKGQE